VTENICRRALAREQAKCGAGAGAGSF